ncbi:MAG: type I secretion system permease/ATPase [Burkholderiales bacterium]|nr:type I secretion system permease/ATPase [Burkholderiales bacterium]
MTRQTDPASSEATNSVDDHLSGAASNVGEAVPDSAVNAPLPSGLHALTGIASYFRIGADPEYLRRELAIKAGEVEPDDILRAAKLVGLKARKIERLDGKRLTDLPVPTILRLRSGLFVVYGGHQEGRYRIVDPMTRADRVLALDEIFAEIEPIAILVTRRLRGAGVDPENFGFHWFWPSIWRYRKPIAHVLLASFVVQIFALVTPLFFQVVIDKVLAHRSYSTLFVIVIGLAIIGLFDVVLHHLRTYALTHTSNRIDVELGQRLFAHLLRLPLSYFETRAAGQTVARMRELETIRNFLTGQGLFSALDLLFAVVFITVLFLYSWKLTLIVLLTIPLYLLIAALIRPILKMKIEEKFNRAALSQQFLVESVVGVQTIKAAAIEPVMRAQWEERLAAYVKTGFEATMLGSLGQNAIQYVDKLSRAALLLFGAKAVIDGELSVGSLVAFNMIAAQVAQPILRLSQLWQDFQQIQISVARLGDILNTPTEPVSQAMANLPPPKGQIEIRNVSFRYRNGGPEVLKNISLGIRPGEVIGIVGPSGSGKSSLTKLVQRLYLPHEGQILVDGVDIAQADPAWLRHHIGVVLQENLLFNRSLHDNIALADPSMPRPQVMRFAKLAGADEFIGKLPQGYDTMIEERGTNLSGGQRQRIAIARALATN